MTRVGESATRVALVLASVALSVALADCTSAGGPSFITFGVSVGASPTGTGGSSSGERPADLCVRLPVLLGSSVDKKATIASGLTAKVEATREGATLTFPGADDDEATRTYTLEELTGGLVEAVEVMVDGNVFDASIATGCTNP